MLTVLDRKKRKVILKSTSLLPRPLRIAAREPLLARHELGKALRARRFIIGHPKSGNTWLRTMISRLYQNRYGLPDDLLLKSDELAAHDRKIPRFLVTNGYYSYEGVILRSIPVRFRDRLVLFLARHPCDIAVSWYIQFTKRISVGKRELVNATLSEPVDHLTVPQWDFVMHPELGLPGIIRYLNRSYGIVSALEHGMTSNYESLRTKPKEELARIMEFFELPFTPAEIEQAVDYASFDNLRKLETSGHFQRGGLRVKVPGDPGAVKVRRGKIHGYRDDFEPDQVRQMDELVARELDPRLAAELAAASPASPSAGT
jgi:hypothetical protein